MTLNTEESAREREGIARIYTDGACIGNPGPGGYAAIILIGDTEHIVTGRDANTTSNRMEMIAAIRALEKLPKGLAAVVTSDSQYVVKGMTEWLPGWKRQGWRTTGNKPVANQPLWERLDKLLGERPVMWRWVRGHAGHAMSERADGLVNSQALRAAKEVGWTPTDRFGFFPKGLSDAQFSPQGGL